MRPSDLGRAAGVSTDTLRHYERLGILQKPLRTRGGYRVYPPDALQRVRLVQCALDAGFTLRELAAILRERDAGGFPCARVLKLARDKLHRLDEQITLLQQLRGALGATVRDWGSRLDMPLPDGRAHLLESLSESHPNKPGEASEHTIARFMYGDFGGRIRQWRRAAPRTRSAAGDT